MPVCGSGAVVVSWSLLIRRHQRARCQAEIPLIALCKMPEPPLGACCTNAHLTKAARLNERDQNCERQDFVSGLGNFIKTKRQPRLPGEEAVPFAIFAGE